MSITKINNFAFRAFGVLLIVVGVSMTVYGQVAKRHQDLPRDEDTCGSVSAFGWYYADHLGKGATPEAAEVFTLNFLDGFVGVKGDPIREEYFKLAVSITNNNWTYLSKDVKTADKNIKQLCLAGVN